MKDIDLANLKPIQGFNISGPKAYAQTGRAVSSFYNKEGIPNLVIGAPGTNPNGRENAGTVYVIRNSNLNNIDLNHIDLKNLTQGYTISGAKAGNQIGSSLKSVNDFDGDGNPILFIGVPEVDLDTKENAGAVYVIHNNNSANIDLGNLTEKEGFTIFGAEEGDYTGWIVTSVGPNNLILTAPLADPLDRQDAGIVYVIYNISGVLNNIYLENLKLDQGVRIFGAEENDETGYSVATYNINPYTIGIIIGAPRANEDVGIVYIVRHNIDNPKDIDLANLRQDQGLRIFGDKKGDQAGFSVSVIFDFNGDGTKHWVIGAKSADPSGRKNAGIVYFVHITDDSNDIYLANLTPEQGFRTLGAKENDQAGWSVGSAYKNGDGINLPIGVPGANPYDRNNAGTIDFVHRNTGSSDDIDLANPTSRESLFRILGAEKGNQIGYSLLTIIDINLDGISDLFIGVNQASPNSRYKAGAVYGVYGRKQIFGTSEDDIISPTKKWEDINGGSGINTLNYETSDAGVKVNLETNEVSGGTAHGDTIANFQNVIGSKFNDVLVGTNGPNVILGGEGDDLIEGKEGSDVLDGGSGIDTVTFENGPSVEVDLSKGKAILDGIHQSIKNIENAIGSNYDDKLKGDHGNNILQGGKGDDTIENGGGKSVLIGGKGSDTFIITNFPGITTIRDFEIHNNENIDLTQFTDIKNFADLKIEGIQEGTRINLHSDVQKSQFTKIEDFKEAQREMTQDEIYDVQIMLEHVKPNDLNAEHFIFSEEKEKSSSNWSAIIPAISLGLSFVAIVGWCLHKCKKNSICCFKAAIAPIATEVVENTQKLLGGVKEPETEV